MFSSIFSIFGHITNITTSVCQLQDTSIKNNSSTMAHEPEVSLPTLPVELLHRVFDDLDASTILFSVQNVCRQLKTVVDTYHRYKLDFNWTSQPDFNRLLRLIRPDRVTSLVLVDDWMTPGQISAFQSLVDIHHFTRLHSLTLLNVDAWDLCLFLDHATRCSLTSLKIQSRSLDFSRRIILQQLSSIIAQPTLQHLDLLHEHLYTVL
jgi:F-box-like